MSARNVLRRWVIALKNGFKADLTSSDSLKILPAVDDTGKIQIGDGTNDMDFQVFLGSTGEHVLFDVGNSTVTFTGVNIGGAGSTLVPLVPLAAQQTLAAGGGAVTITEFYTAGASDAGGDAWTLVDGAQLGQLKKIQLITDGGGDATLTPTTLAAGTTIVFADAGDYVVLMWGASGWVALELGNDADGASAPVLS